MMRFGPLVSGLALLVLLGSSVPQTASVGPLDPQRPNVLVIIVDDQRANEGTLKVMPKTRRWLGRRGTRYSSAFSTTPLCCPARASLFSGRYAHNHGVFSNLGKLHFEHRFTVQDYLDNAGYRTAMAGKLFNNWPLKRDPPHFDRWALFDGGYFYGRYNVNGTIKEIAAYSTNVLGRRSRAFLKEFEKTDDRPWFLYVAPYAPHAPFTADRRYRGSAVPGWDGNPAVFEKNRSDKPDYVRLRDETYETWKRNRRIQLRSLRSVDDLVGSLRSTMRRLKEDTDTIIFYMSDNGYMWADHGLFDKGAPYTPSIQIPMFMRLPKGSDQPGIDPRLTGLIDVAPTILDVTGLTPDAQHPMDGRSLLSPEPPRQRIFSEYRNNDNIWTPPTWASTRTGDFQYVEYYDDGKRIFREYYDLKKDPWQLRNLLGDKNKANDPDPATLQALSAQLAADRDCVGAQCP
jgi:arylsulfatase A-like enzyme